MRIAVRLLILAGLLAAAAYLLWQLFRPPAVETAPPQRGPAVEAVYATGLVEPSLEIRIAPQAGGRLVELLAFEGNRVEKGQLLARLEDSDLRASVKELEARLEYARALARRNDELAASGLVPRDTADRTRADMEAARASLVRAREQLDYMRIVAPSDGLVIRRDGEIGEFIPVNETIFYLAGPAPLRITADVDEEDVPRLVAGLPVVIRADAFPGRVFDGTVSQITPRGDPVSRSYRVRIALEGDTPLQSGMTTETNIVLDRRENVLLVPSDAVVDGAVFVVQDGHAVRREVEVGVVGPSLTEVRQGLDESARVVRSPGASLEDGSRVTVTDGA